MGRSPTEPVKNGQLPKVQKISGWDGKDGEVGMGVPRRISIVGNHLPLVSLILHMKF